MTREHKLALIVGFSLILLVGVLISDHLSSARQAQVGDYGPGDFRVSETPLLLPTEPLRTSGGWGAVTSEPQTAEMDVVPELPSTVGMMSAGVPEPRVHEAPVGPPVEPVVIRQGSLAMAPGSDPVVDPALARELAERGAIVRPGNGVPEIVLPAAAQLREPERDVPRAAEEYDWHTVKPGESLYKIAAMHLRDGKRWRELVKLNAGRVGEDGSVRVGVKLRVPRQAGAVLRTVAYQPPAPRSVPEKPVAPKSYTVQRGDTLGVISQKTLGTAKRLREIMELNGIDDEDHVQAGMVLKIPGR